MIIPMVMMMFVGRMEFDVFHPRRNIASTVCG